MTIRVAIVGTGKVADQNYLPHIVKNEDVVLSYYNRTQAKAQAMADKYGGRVAGSLADLMADDPDTVLVLTMETDRYQVTDALLAHKSKAHLLRKAAGGHARPGRCG